MGVGSVRSPSVGSKGSVTAGSESVSDDDFSTFQGVSAAALDGMVRRAVTEVLKCDLARQGVPSRKQPVRGGAAYSSTAFRVVHGDSGYAPVEPRQVAGYRFETQVSHRPPFPDYCKGGSDF